MDLTPQQPAMPNEKTYRVWAMKVEAMLDKEDLFDLVLGQAGSPSETASDWKRKQRKAYNLIIGQLDDANLALLDKSIASERCPQRLWHKIKEMYGEMSSAERKKAWMSFYACPSNADLGGLIAHFQLTAPFIKLMEADGGSATEAAVAYVLGKLPERLSTLRDTHCKDESFCTVDRLLEKLEEEMRRLQSVKLEPKDIVAAQPMHFSKDEKPSISHFPNIRLPEASEAVFVETVTACEAPSRTSRAQPQLIAQVHRYCAIGNPPKLQQASYSDTADELPKNARETRRPDLLALAISRAESQDFACESALSRAPEYSASASSGTETSDLAISLNKSAMHVLPTPKKPLPRFAGSVTMDVLRYEIQRRYPLILIYCCARKPTIAALYHALSVQGPTQEVINNLDRYNSVLIDTDYRRMLKMKFKTGKRILKDDYRALIQIIRPSTSMPYLMRLPELQGLYEEYC